MKVVVASNNAHKVEEIQHVLGSNLELISQREFDIPSPAETGTTFVENAIIKARYSSQITGLPAIADDSGLEVDYLGGSPGIYSARFAGADADDEANNQKLLHELQNVTERNARFQCVIVFMRSARDPTPLIATGAWEGQILEEPRGDQGFGYDPLFYLPNLARSVGELSEAEKSALSHRGQALEKLRVMLQTL